MKGWVARVCTSFIDVPDKVAIAIYFSGCSLRCKDCQNKELWDMKSGKETAVEEVVEKVKKHPLAEYVVFLGGEPTDQMDFLIKVCDQIKNKINLPIALYTGREFEILPENLLDNLNLIVCGPYRSELHVGGWPASSNQRIFKKLEGTWKC